MVYQSLIRTSFILVEAKISSRKISFQCHYNFFFWFFNSEKQIFALNFEILTTIF